MCEAIDQAPFALEQLTLRPFGPDHELADSHVEPEQDFPSGLLRADSACLIGSAWVANFGVDKNDEGPDTSRAWQEVFACLTSTRHPHIHKTPESTLGTLQAFGQ